MIEIRLLRYLIAVADAGTVAGAAREVHVAQPSLSRQIHALERSLGFAVFDRSGIPLKLTAAGREFIQEARELLHRAEETELKAQRLASGLPSKITITSPVSLIADLLTPFMAKNLAPDDPYIDLWPIQASEAHASLEAGADIAIASIPALGHHESQLLAAVPLFAQVRADHPWAVRQKIHVRELAEHSLALPTQTHRTRVLLDNIMNDMGLTYGSYIDCRLAVAAQAMAASGRSIAILLDLPMFDLIAIPLCTDNGPIEVRVNAIWKRENFASSQIARLAARIGTYYRELLTALMEPNGSMGNNPY